MEINEINISKAKVHNLKEVSLAIPKNSLTVITGPSGSGKSSLAFDTIYVEGQRRYIESLSSYARQFLGQFQPPDVESITGLSPAIAIDQKSTSKNPRSTVGTVTEIYDYMRVLFARVGTLHCPESGQEIRSFTPIQVTRELLKLPEKTKLHILAPVIENEKGNHQNTLSKFLGMGFSKIRVNGEVEPLSNEIKLKKSEAYTVEIVIDRLLVRPEIEKRLTDSIELCYKLSNGTAMVLIGEKEIRLFSEKNISPITKEVLPDLEPRLFSFNSPLGACPHCNGLGQMKTFDKNKMILDPKLTIKQGAITPITKKNTFLYRMVMDVAKQEGIDLNKPLDKLSSKHQKILFEGSNKVYKYSFKSENSNFEFSKSFPGIVSWLEKKFNETGSERVRKDLEQYMDIKKCPYCGGKRLNPVALSTLIGKHNIIDLCSLSIRQCSEEVEKTNLSGEKAKIAEKLLKEINNRLHFLLEVGLDYLTLDRSASTLSGGESQRIRLATQIGSALSGVLYVLDEPSIGLHQRDNNKLISTLKSLRDIGNTVLVVEHDEDTMSACDYIVDMGPGAGIHGGMVVSKGPLKDILKDKNSVTANYLSGREKIEVPTERRELTKKIHLKGATHNNLNKLSVEIPLDGMVCITGVSGSGKSTLVHEVLVPAIRNYFSKGQDSIYRRDNYHAISGVSHIQSVIELDQSPIGRTPHSNPATYTKLFDSIRNLYAKTTEAQIRGYKAGRFSFNVKGGRCEECEGNGVKKIEMHFLPDVYITCSECHGSRYNKDTLSVLYRGKNIADVLNMEIEEGVEFFSNHPKIHRALKTLNDVGLGYMKLGQPATTLSGGEAQRLKLSRELSKKPRGKCLYILDEPTTGLHFQDIKVLLSAINQLIEQGHSVLIIEHNLDVIKTADHVIDLGPEGGDKGGEIVAEGTPEDITKVKKSYTGQYLKKLL